MIVGKGAGYGFGGAIGVIFALVLIFVVLPMVGCVGCVAIAVIGGSMYEEPQFETSDEVKPSDTETDDLKEPDDDDSHNSSSDEVPGVSQLERRCRLTHDLCVDNHNTQGTSRFELIERRSMA